MKTIGVLTSGGDAPGMNAAIRAVVRTGAYNDIRTLGIMRGFHGLIRDEIQELDMSAVGDILHRGGTILRTARSEEFKTEAGMQKAIGVIKKHGIEGIVVIGGDGSFRGARDLTRLGVPTVGLPGTIDNDIACTDYTIGFSTAVNTVIDAINKLRDTASSHDRISIVEVMGRNAGDIALYSGIAGGAESIIVPELPFDVDEICKRIIQGRNRGKQHNIIVLAEGVVLNKEISGTIEVGKEIEAKTGLEVKVTILGHIQRGGSPTAFDRILASSMGARAVELLKQGIGNRVVGIRDNHIVDFEIEEALSMKRSFNQNLYQLAQILSM
ncbi:6-phosphofructokinase [Mahella sp.]|uniref:6-phosphofructokinase n=1 Tax=Mahella sp. TaxID=2798721 RepID=UPI0025BF57BD|nr:6-phosphofructokinase [Mahella sp.]MBZ4665315.1 6-phosphofructokinase [Mahella sp.]MDK2903302.1 6-phosphofructokinase 1 [Clostridiales bacterium]